MAVAEGWIEGFLPDLLKFGLDLCVGAPSSSDEAYRSFAWKTMESEHGFGTLVVEKTPRSYAPSTKLKSLTLVSKEADSGGTGVAGEGIEEEPLCPPSVDMDGVSIYGNYAFEFQNPYTLTGAPATELLGGGPSYILIGAPASELLGGGPSFTSGLAQCVPAVACAMLNAEVIKDKTANRALVNTSGLCKSPVSAKEDKRAELQALDNRLGVAKMTESSVPTDDGSGRFDRGDGGSYKGPMLKPILNGSEELSQLVMPDRSYGGASLGMGVYLDDKSDTHQSLESPSSLSAEALSSFREGNINSDMCFRARHEDITIIDNEEALSFDSPVLDCRFSFVEKMSADDGVRCPDECWSGSEKEQWSFNMVEKMCQIGFIRQEDRALIQAHIISDLLQDA